VRGGVCEREMECGNDKSFCKAKIIFEFVEWKDDEFRVLFCAKGIVDFILYLHNNYVGM